MASSRLKVNCNLEGAEVFLDGKFKGECPVEFEVSAGKHKVVLRKDIEDGSYYYYERETRVGEDVVQEINAKLERIYTEQYFWNRAEEHGKIESYKEYLKKYPEGKFANEAKMKIARKVAEEKACKVPFEKTIANMRALGTALGSFQVDNNRFPIAEKSTVSAINAMIFPYYRDRPHTDAGEQISVKDAWGTDFYYSSDGQGYTLKSWGKDKAEGSGTSECDSDIVYINAFFRAPRPMW